MVDLLALASLIIGIVIIKNFRKNIIHKYSKPLLMLGLILIIVPSLYIVKEFSTGFIKGVMKPSINLNQNIN